MNSVKRGLGTEREGAGPGRRRCFPARVVDSTRCWSSAHSCRHVWGKGAAGALESPELNPNSNPRGTIVGKGAGGLWELLIKS